MTSLEQLHKLAGQIAPVALPGCLQRPEFRFCRVGFTKATLIGKIAQIKAESDTEQALKDAESALKDFKKPFGTDWQIKTFQFTDPALSQWLAQGGNYGVVAGGEWQHEDEQVRLYLHDADDVKAWTDAGFFDGLPKRTTTVQSSTENKRHFYFLSNIKSTKAHSELPPVGHLKFERSQVVAPASLHPSGCRYALIDMSAPAYVDAETLTNAIVTATKVLLPDKVAEVKKMLGVKTTAGRLKENTDLLDEKLKQAKVDRLKRNQQQEAQSEAAYNAVKSTISTQADINTQEEELKARIKPIEGLIKEIGKDNTINLCLRRLNASIPTLNRFEKAVSYQGKPGEGEHFLRRAWAVALIKSGYPDSKIHQMAQHFDDYTQARTQQQIDSIRSWVEDGGNYYPCAEIKTYLPPELWCQGCRWTPPEQDQDTTVTDSGGEATGQTTADPEICTKAEEIVNSGQFPETWTQVFLRRHNGDGHIATTMAAANLTANIKNSTGIAVLQVAGESGDGKSHAVLCCAEQMGKWCDISGLSPMALLYHAGKSIFEGMMVVLDDNRPDDRQADIVKKSSTQFKKGYRYKTVIKGKDVILQMPPGVQLLTTEVDADSEDQVLNRCLLSEVKGSPEKDIAIIAADLERLETGESGDEDPDIAVCRVAFDMLKSKKYVVTIPDARNRIKWTEKSKTERANVRNYNIFIDLLKTYAVMRWPCRVHHEDELGVMHIEATRQDFMDALALYNRVHKQMQTKLLSAEIKLLDLINKEGGRVSREDVLQKLGISRQRLDVLVRGRNGKSGILGKYPGFYIEEATESESKSAGTNYYDPRVKKKYLCLTDTVPVTNGQTLITSRPTAEWIED